MCAPANRTLLSGVLTLVLTIPAAGADPPLALHPDNPHYFLFRGRPTVLISSAEHYGAVLNRDFDYARYLAELESHGLNQTRTFAGAYCESPGSFNIARNTLAPAAGKFICPWARSETPGYPKGGNKFDLARFDDAYFARLRDLVAEASRRGVVVELNLFCPFYGDEMWRLSPMNTANNVNNVGNVSRTDVYTLDMHGGLLAFQDAMVRRIVAELADFDNVYYEVCNEPYFGGVTMEWQRHIVDTIVDAEKGIEHRHLISLNIANGSAKVTDPPPAVSIFNFHYANPPAAVAENFGLNKVIGDNETGFRGTGDIPYRQEAWQFLLAGGALFSHLDYSFAVGHEDGTFEYPDKQPGGGNRGFRRQMGVLKKFIESFAFVRMAPHNELLKVALKEKESAYLLAEPGRQYAAYVFARGPVEVTLELPEGKYAGEWLNPVTGEAVQTVSVEGGHLTLKSPAFETDIALRLKAH
jgi:hypothetical protein